MQDRDFKGIWIPKEIWLCDKLSIIEKALFAEINSLDGENHCFATNEYFSEFFDVSVSTITRSIKKLKDQGFIDYEMVKTQNGTQRVIKVVRTNQFDETPSRQIDETPLVKLTTIYNNTNNTNKNDIISKDIISSENAPEFNFGKQFPKQPNLYQKCISLIDGWTDLPEIRTPLVQYLDLCMEMKCIRGANQWKGMLKTLERVQEQCHPHTFEEIIEQSINRGYKTFYPINDYRTTKAPDNVKSIKMTAEEKEELYRLAEEREQNGQVGYY